MYPGGEHALHRAEGALDFARQSSHELSMLGELARDQRALTHGVEEPWRALCGQFFFPKRGNRTRGIVARDGHSKPAFGGGIGLSIGGHSRPIEGDHHTIGLRLVETSGDRYAARRYRREEQDARTDRA